MATRPKTEYINVDPSKDKKLNINSKKEKIKRLKSLTKFKYVKPSETMKKGKSKKEKFDDCCPICLEKYDKVSEIVSICEENHCFHLDCLLHCYDSKNNFLKCPTCGEGFGIIYGPMPKGTMKIEYLKRNQCPLSGYKCDTIRITYSFPSGKQGTQHPKPGASYGGTSRIAYLPDDKLGNLVLEKLKISFRRRLTFRIGTSVTSGQQNVTIWNGVHHKTCTSGGFRSFGYPDKGYFDRVLSELYLKGIK